jgi:DNA gyrase/topoisomerase IV subunit B
MDEIRKESKELSIEKQFQAMTEIEHILARPGMYVGSIYSELKDLHLFKPSENKIVEIKGVSYNAGLLKLVDEVFTNPIDERRKKTRTFDINEINVNVNTDGTVIISDDGGIPVVIHKELNVYLPRLLFGMLRTSGNYTGDRAGAGLNGIGSKLTNIYSKYFRVTTSDTKKQIDIQWSNNMQNIDFENVTDVNGTHKSRFEFKIDLARFELTSLDMATIRIIQKRCIDGAAANPGLKINFESNVADGALNSSWKFDTFEEFVNLHLDKNVQKISQHGFDDIIIIPSIGYNYGFVNGAVCLDVEGTQYKKIYKQIVDKVLEILKKKEIELITDKDIKNKISIFCSVNILNPDYSSQTKEKLTSKIPLDKLRLSKQFLESLEDCEIVNQLVDYYNIKYLAEQRKTLRKLNGALKSTKTKKLITCSNKNGLNNELWLFEGTSASNGFENYRNPEIMACYQLRGKVKNTLNLSKEDIVNNIELREIIATLGLQFGDPKYNIKYCKFKKIIIASDMDPDGDHICGLLLVFFAKNFPELFLDNRIFRAVSPIVIADKGEEEKFFYTLEEFEAEKSTLKGWNIEYIKGLGSLQDRHYDEMLNNQRLMKFTIKNKDYMTTIRTWFDKSTTLRKEILMEESVYFEDAEVA